VVDRLGSVGANHRSTLLLRGGTLHKEAADIGWQLQLAIAT